MYDEYSLPDKTLALLTVKLTFKVLLSGCVVCVRHSQFLHPEILTVFVYTVEIS